MKMVIVQNEKKIAIALRDDGTFVKIPQRGYQVGQTLTAMPARKSILQFSRAGVAAAVVILFGCSSVFAARMPYSYVMMDVNPSVKYTLNIFDHVLSIDAVNEDAELIVEALNQQSISSHKLDDAIDMTIAQCQQDGYLYKDTKDYVVLSVMSVSTRRADSLAKNLEKCRFGDGFIAAEIVSSTIEEMKKDEQQGTTPGKLEIINKMQKKIGDDKSSEEWIHVPIRQIIEASEAEDAVQTQQSDPQTTSKTQNNAANQNTVTTDKMQRETSDTQDVLASSNSSASYQPEAGGTQQPAKNTIVQSTPESAKEETQALPSISNETAPLVEPQQILSPEFENGDALHPQTGQTLTEKVNSEVPSVSQTEKVAAQQTVTKMPSSTLRYTEVTDERQSHETPGR